MARDSTNTDLLIAAAAALLFYIPPEFGPILTRGITEQ